jgi:pyruvate,orthophosphate dikinase
MIDYKAGTLTVDGKRFKEGDSLTIDGATGEVIEGVVPTIEGVSSSGNSVRQK